MQYTVVFLFTKNGEDILLTRKDRTIYQGQLNGVGGKVEPGGDTTPRSYKRSQGRNRGRHF